MPTLNLSRVLSALARAVRGRNQTERGRNQTERGRNQTEDDERLSPVNDYQLDYLHLSAEEIKMMSVLGQQAKKTRRGLDGSLYGILGAPQSPSAQSDISLATVTRPLFDRGPLPEDKSLQPSSDISQQSLTWPRSYTASPSLGHCERHEQGKVFNAGDVYNQSVQATVVAQEACPPGQASDTTSKDTGDITSDLLEEIGEIFSSSNYSATRDMYWRADQASGA
ncbi:hypothetical protein RHS03_06318, partial [Rhizoctonia solani]